MSNTPTI